MQADDIDEEQKDELQSETTAQQIVEHEINDKRIEIASPRSEDKRDSRSGSPTFADDNPLNVFNERATEEEAFDIEELKRIERIL